MGTFTAIDFETAQGKRWSICQIGIVRIVNGTVTDKVNRLIRPPGNSYNYYNTQVHGINASATRGAPHFDEVWPEISHLIHGQVVVAHNGAFDFSCLAQVLDYYSLSHPVYEKQCTYKIYGKKLSLLCQEHGIELNHHDALSDAMACAELYRRHLGI